MRPANPGRKSGYWIDRQVNWQTPSACTRARTNLFLTVRVICMVWIDWLIVIGLNGGIIAFGLYLARGNLPKNKLTGKKRGPVPGCETASWPSASWSLTQADTGGRHGYHPCSDGP